MPFQFNPASRMDRDDTKPWPASPVMALIAIGLMVGVMLVAASSMSEAGGDPTVTPIASAVPTSATTPADAPIARAEAGVSANADWEPFIQAFDGYEMALVPAGCFMMGSEDGESNEQPVHEVCFEEPFWIDVYEVTNAQYGGPSPSDYCSRDSSADDQPRNCVSWFDAQAFCEGRGGSLPSEAQWEYAARGPSGWVYPWGDDAEEDYAVFSGNSDGQTAPVGSRPEGVSWVGAQDMAGNVSEWTTTIYDQDTYPYPYSATDGRDDVESPDAPSRVFRGGTFIYTMPYLRGSVRDEFDPYEENFTFGVRCVLPLDAMP